MLVEFDVDPVGAVRISATVFPDNRARFVRVGKKVVRQGWPSNGSTSVLVVAGIDCSKGFCAELPSGPGIRRVTPTKTGRCGKTDRREPAADKNGSVIICDQDQSKAPQRTCPALPRSNRRDPAKLLEAAWRQVPPASKEPKLLKVLACWVPVTVV